MPLADAPSTPPSLLERVRRKEDREGWSRFVDLYTPILLFWVEKLNIPASDRPDVVQEVFAVLIRNLPDFRYDSSQRFRGYLFTICRSRTSDFHRRKQARISTVQNEPVEIAADADELEQLITEDYAVRVLRRATAINASDFAPAAAEAFRRKVFGGENAADTAAALGITVGSVYQAKFLIIKRMREEFAGLLDCTRGQV